MAEWLFEDGIGEARAALVDRGRMVEMQIEADDDPLPRAGAVVSARLSRKPDASGRGLVTLADGTSARLLAVPPKLTEGSALTVEVVRAPLPEAGAWKPAVVRATDAAPAPAPTLHDRLKQNGAPVRLTDARDDALEAHGWSERLEEAASGIVTHTELMLRISLTPAMTLIDVDGAGSAVALARAGARAAGETIRLFDLAGSIGIDLPTLVAKADRQAAAQALDTALPQPFERTAVNGFGFLQIVRRRSRMSLPEQIGSDPVGHAARALLRLGERAPGFGAVALVAATPVVQRLEARPSWTETLARRIGGPVTLRPEPGLAISAGYAARAQS